MGSSYRASWGTGSLVGTVRVLAGNARDCGGHATTASAILGTQEPTCFPRIVRYRRHGNARRRQLRASPDEQMGKPMVLQPSAHNQLAEHRVAAKESCDLMRATIADIEEII